VTAIAVIGRPSELTPERKRFETDCVAAAASQIQNRLG